MKRIIYSLYIDIPAEDLDYQPPYPGDDIPKTQRTRLQFIDHYDRLKQSHQWYSNSINVNYTLYEYDSQYKNFHEWMKKTYPQINEYCIVNFYKIHLLYELAKDYDEILYLDFDVIPMTDLNFFDQWDLKKGLAILNNNDDRGLLQKHKIKVNNIRGSNRSPTAKFWNCRAMLFEEGFESHNDVYNTGIIGASKEHLSKLDYWGEFDKTIELMDYVKQDDLYPQHVLDMFGYDNETIWSYKVKTNNVLVQWLDTDWHYFFDNSYDWIPKKTKLVHTINKKFDVVWETCKMRKISYE
tara:strand:+ start:338 stop:1225 length:888 start_codon:yes stop_codon:yes gene_type:complete